MGSREDEEAEEEEKEKKKKKKKKRKKKKKKMMMMMMTMITAPLLHHQECTRNHSLTHLLTPSLTDCSTMSSGLYRVLSVLSESC
ncbi:hypothetical protein BO82DRAFT_354089 [Aspergillus uvarum CBS 121591]|uniref:Uncharacterized protein n=1 Tax=Aspergillus uvarum CBS 121591 TaxID=1448315 RepID=A0A319CD38_9EURO|nr:hypothetical protein BO82DRAFT_354089 [Aspergillus uvarum CBS 121591]PYH82209.1 hypothetical protein BO82DRAFT_354089 [Aspergillus uvarum CBS 121591]